MRIKSFILNSLKTRFLDFRQQFDE